MILVEEKRDHRTSTQCSCGGTADLRTGSHVFNIGQKKITLQNVPHFYCEYCEKAIFGPGIDPTSILRYAYLHNLSRIDWNKRDSYL
ncbi:YgiT-type zinc finger protein [Paenibacillus solani]|uniref:YgiT-type zinc finger protein n=1 Tax=Paenibacillus solani TaxID=1705565 RepID=UPI0009EC6873